MRLDAADMDLLNLLTWRVRLATERQLREFSPKATAPRRLQQAGLLAKASVAVSLLELDGPLASWAPGLPLPNFPSLAWRLHQRRLSAPSRSVLIYWATPRAVRVAGGVGGEIRQPMQVEHDLGATAIFLRRRILDPASTSRWLGEDIYRQLHAPVGKIPDALLCSADGTPELAIEFGGAYGVGRIRGFHRHCASKLLPWELW